MVFDYIKNFDKLDVEICKVYSCQRFEVKFSNRVTADLENLEMSGNLKETSESQGICPKKSGNIVTELQKSGEVRDIFCLKLIFS